jgi:zinc protease
MRQLILLLMGAAWVQAQIRPQIPGLETPKPGSAPAPAGAPATRPGRGAAAAPPASAASGALPLPKDLKYPPLHAVRPPEVTVASLPNGLKLYLAEDHELPVMGGVVMIRTGSVFDPPERIGLAALAGNLLRNGGTAVKTGDQVDDALQRLGMTMDSSIGESAGLVRFTSVKQNAEPALVLLREVLTQAEFRQDRLEQAKKLLRDRIAHRNDDLAETAQRELSSLIFGKDTPFGWQPEYAGVDRITRKDLRNFHKRFFFPSNVMLGLWGDFSAPQMKDLVEKVFGSWDAAGQPPAIPAPQSAPAPGLYLAEGTQAQVSYVALGQPGGLISDKDFPALDVMGALFSQLQARLTQHARSQVGPASVALRGVTVEDVRADWGGRLDRQGLFVVQCASRGAATVDVIKAVQADIERMRSVEVSEEELNSAKSSLLSQLSSLWDNPAKAFERWMRQEYYGHARDFPQRYQAGVMGVTRADVVRVAKQYLNPASLTTMVIGNPQVFSTPLERLNPQVNRIDLTIPEPKPVLTEATDETITEGKRLLARAQAAVGGADKLAAVKDYLLASEYLLDASVPNMGGTKVPQTDRWLAPAAFRQDIAIPTGRLSAFSDGRAGWIATPQGWGGLAGVQLKQLQGDLFRAYFTLLLSDRMQGRTVNMVDENMVEITDTAGQLVRLEFDPTSGLPRRISYDVPQAAGPSLFTEESYDDFREVAGIKVPYKTVIMRAGKKFADVAVTECKVNAGLKLVDLARRPQ